VVFGVEGFGGRLGKPSTLSMCVFTDEESVRPCMHKCLSNKSQFALTAQGHCAALLLGRQPCSADPVAVAYLCVTEYQSDLCATWILWTGLGVVVD
jgi:hypothetical protein